MGNPPLNASIMALFAVMLFSGVWGISSGDAVNFVVTSNHFLYEGETYTPPNVPIAFGEESYWVIPLTAGSNIITYFPVDAQSGELSVSRSTNRGLFEVADSLRELQLMKASLSQGSGVQWIFTQQYQTIFNEMSLQLSDEVFQINTVETTLRGEGVPVNVSSLKNELGSLSESASGISEKISAAASAENEFATKPSPETFSQMNSSFNGVFDSIQALNDDGLVYKSNLDKLKQQISVADMDTQTKSQLFALLEVPQGLQALRNYNIYSTQINGSWDSSIQASSLRMDTLLAEFDNRIAKNESYLIIYGENAKLGKETEFSNLLEAKSAILSAENRSLWENQQKVRELEQDYSRAVKYYEERNFEQAQKFAQSSIDDAISVYKKGYKKQIPPPGISQDFLFQVAIALIVLLVLLYVFNNRGKLSGMVQKPGEEVDIYG